MNPRWYPLRVQAQKLYQSGDPKIVLRKHPGYAVKMDPAQEQVDYAQEIARHKLGLIGAGMGLAQAAPYILAKHFEIAAAGSVVVTDNLVAPLMRRLGFIENVHYLATTPDTLESELNTWLKPENDEHLVQGFLTTDGTRRLMSNYGRCLRKLNTVSIYSNYYDKSPEGVWQ